MSQMCFDVVTTNEGGKNESNVVRYWESCSKNRKPGKVGSGVKHVAEQPALPMLALVTVDG